MTFWDTFEKAKTTQKSTFVRQTDIVEFVNKETDFSTDDHTAVRFLGAMYGINTINVPIIRDNRFYRKKDTNQLIALPKQVLGYDYRTKQLDESKCPYLQYVNLDNELLLVATINYVKESNIKDKEYLLNALENTGLKNCYWNDKQAREIIQSSRELSMHLASIASKGTREYFSNILIYPVNKQAINAYTDMSVRTMSEQTPQAFLDYTTTYGEKVFFKDNKQTVAPTPVKVIRLTAKHLEKLFNDIVKLNTVTIDKDTKEKEIKGIEDPNFGCAVNVRLDPMAFRTMAGKPTYSFAFTRGDREELSDAEKKFLLWDLRKLGSQETYDDALKFLTEGGYCSKVISNKFVDMSGNSNQPVQAQVKAPVADELPWDTTPAKPAEEVKPQVQPVVEAAKEEAAAETPKAKVEEILETPAEVKEVKEKPVKKIVQSKQIDDDFDSIFS